MSKFYYGKNTLTAMLAMMTLLLIGLACGGEKPSAPPTEADAQALVKDTISQFADAVDKGDFAAFKANASKEFQTQFTDDQLKTAFKDFITQKAAVVPILRDAAKKNAVSTPAPAVKDEKGYSILTAAGTIDSDPQPIRINNEYVYQDGKWKLLRVEVYLQ